MTEVERLQQEIEKYARDRNWEFHKRAIEMLIDLIRKEKTS